MARPDYLPFLPDKNEFVFLINNSFVVSLRSDRYLLPLGCIYLWTLRISGVKHKMSADSCFIEWVFFVGGGCMFRGKSEGVTEREKRSSRKKYERETDAPTSPTRRAQTQRPPYTQTPHSQPHHGDSTATHIVMEMRRPAGVWGVWSVLFFATSYWDEAIDLSLHAHSTAKDGREMGFKEIRYVRPATGSGSLVCVRAKRWKCGFMHKYKHTQWPERRQMVGVRARATRVRTIVRPSYPTPPQPSLRSWDGVEVEGRSRNPSSHWSGGFESRCLADGRRPSPRIQTSLHSLRERTWRGQTGGPCVDSTRVYVFSPVFFNEDKIPKLVLVSRRTKNMFFRVHWNEKQPCKTVDVTLIKTTSTYV